MLAKSGYMVGWEIRVDAGSHPSVLRSRLDSHFSISKWRNGNRGGSAKQMDVIRHQHVSPNQPCIRFLPAFNHQVVDGLVGEQPTSSFNTNGQKNNDRLITMMNRRVMRQGFSFREKPLKAFP